MKTMPRITDVVGFLKRFAPLSLAEDWDNVGLLVGHEEASLSAVVTCLTLTPDVAKEAIEQNANLIVSHHPIMFRPIQQIIASDAQGQMLLELIRAGIAVYSPHTSYDSAARGINQQLAECLGLSNIAPLRPCSVPPHEETAPDHSPLDENTSEIGAGRWGELPDEITLTKFNHLVKQGLEIPHLQYVGDLQTPIRRVAIACGAAAEFLRDAHPLGCDVLLTGEARFHACLEARELGIAMVLPGHYATERPAMEKLSEILSTEFPEISIHPSRIESDPLEWDCCTTNLKHR